MHVIRTHFRSLASSILTVWLTSWILTVFLPCCEVFASAIPHDHSITSSTYNHTATPHETHENAADDAIISRISDHHKPDHHKAVNAATESDHEHCLNEYEIGENSPSLISSIETKRLPTIDTEFPHYIAEYTNYSDAKTNNNFCRSENPPPPRSKLYLSTLRLRI